MHLRWIVSLVGTVSLATICAWAQSALPLNGEVLGVSIRGLWTAANHAPAFSSLPGTIDCGTYTSGGGTGIGTAATIEYQLSQHFYLGLGAAYLPRGGRLTTPNDSEPAFDSTTSRVVNVVTENALDVKLDYIEIAPTLWWIPMIVGRSTFRLDAGLRVGIPLRAQMQQTRRILSPENAVFLSNQQREINWTGGYTEMSSVARPTLGIGVGVEHLLPIGERVHLLQRIAYDYNFTPPVRGVSWTVSGLRAELGIRVSIERSRDVTTPAPPPPPPVDTSKPTIIQPAPLPTPSVRLTLDRFEGHIEEGTELVATTPLVNAVFFEQNSDEIPARYVRRSSDSIATDDAVMAHRNVLLVIASVLHRNPRSNVVLDGATAGDYERGDTALARRRAESVARALIELGVPSERIRVRWSRLPRVPSNMDYPEGRAENQRVDIVLTGAPILEYVSKQTFADVVGNLAVHVGGYSLSGADIELRATGADPRTVHDTGVYAVPVRLRLEHPTGMLRLEAEATIAGTATTDRQALDLSLDTLARRRVELSVSRFEAILRFDYNSSQLSDENRELLRQLVERIPPGTTIEIGGSADVLGDVARNRKLSEERARVTEDYLRSVAMGKQLRIVAQGIERRFSDAVPEGRFLNRSIRVTLR
ncbi:MAG: OmpA family protein [Chlorobi bacterium]|nr:OmpA family protein [Chlorobiota bacterium]